MPSKKDFKGYRRVKKWKQQNLSRSSIINTIGRGYNYSSHITWKFDCCDTKYWPFCVNKPLLKKLKSLESVTLQSIKEEIHGKGGKSSSHYIRNRLELCSKARRRLRQLDLYNRKHLFSLRLKGVVRIFGFLDGHVIHILWLDKHHEVIPTKK